MLTTGSPPLSTVGRLSSDSRIHTDPCIGNATAKVNFWAKKISKNIIHPRDPPPRPLLTGETGIAARKEVFSKTHRRFGKRRWIEKAPAADPTAGVFKGLAVDQLENHLFDPGQEIPHLFFIVSGLDGIEHKLPEQTILIF